MSKHQAILLDSPSRFLWVPAATKTGKTVADAIYITEGLLRGMRCAWVGPWHKRTKTGFDHVKSFLREWEAAGYAKSRESDLTIDVFETTSGKPGRLECFSGDNPDSIYGEAFDRVVCDEATRQPEAVFHAIRSTVTATGGSVRFTMNVDHGSRNWAVREAMRAKRGEEPSYGYLSMTATESPYINPEDIEQARRTLPERVFLALYEAQVSEDGAGVFADPRRCIGGSLAGPVFGHSYVLGVDLARKHDYTVLTVMDVQKRQVVHWDRFHGLPWKVQRDRIAATARTYNSARVILDATGLGDPNLEELQRAGVRAEGIVLSGATKRDLIEKLIVAIENEQIHYPDIPTLISELDVYEYVANDKTGHISYSAPSGYFDDSVISLGMCVAGLGPLARLTSEAYRAIEFGAASSDVEAFACI